MTPLVECIPNVSEGRSPDRVSLLAEGLRDSEGLALLHTHSDPDHHRTVFTLVGEPDALYAALQDLYRRAVAQIDMRTHRGVHLRVGAVDVCPFVPLPEHGSDMTMCVELARRLGGWVASELDVPVLHYGVAATAAHRADLSAIRRGEFEGLAGKLSQAQWAPDHGPTAPHPTAGATVIGARGPLVAYNVVLDSADLQLARRVARRVRASSGGLPGVKAMGVTLASRGLVQVSMNLELPEVTPVEVAVDAVRELSRAEGVEVLETELVGLMPLRSVAGAAASRLQLPALPESLVLEEAIARAFRRPATRP